MEDKLEELRQHIASLAADGALSDSEMDRLKITAQKMGLSAGMLDSMIHQALENSDKGFQPKWYHVVMSVMLIVILSLFVFITIDFDSNGGHVLKDSYRSHRGMQIQPGDIIHVYSGSCNGVAVLISVKSVNETGDGKVVIKYDIKCDFVPVASAAEASANLHDNTIFFAPNPDIDRKVKLGAGKLERTASGKVVIRLQDSKSELMQL